MNSFLDKMRSGAGKAAFEADKLRRVAGLQSDLRRLRGEMEEAIAVVGRVAFDLHQHAQIAPPQLRAVCDQAATVLAEIGAREAELELVRNEQYVESFAAAYEPAALLCPAGHGPLVDGARFCSHCGQAGVAPLPPATASCATCGKPLEAEAQFCVNCGRPRDAQTTVELPHEPAAGRPATVRLDSPAAVRACPACGTAVPDPDTSFCATCGYPFKRAS